MTMYQPSIPTGTVNLDVDYQNLQNNFQQLDTTYGTDHVAYSQAENNGYHTLIHLVPQTAPAPTAGFGQILNATGNDGINTDQTLFYQTGGGKLLQLTRNFQPVPSQNGATFLPGGLIINWGYATSGSGITAVTLTQPFPNNYFNSQATIQRNSASTISIYSTSAPGASPMGGTTAIGFETPAGAGILFFWWALGN